MVEISLEGGREVVAGGVIARNWARDKLETGMEMLLNDTARSGQRTGMLSDVCWTYILTKSPEREEPVTKVVEGTGAAGMMSESKWLWLVVVAFQ